MNQLGHTSSLYGGWSSNHQLHLRFFSLCKDPLLTRTPDTWEEVDLKPPKIGNV